MTELLFHEDAYCTSCDARVVAVTEEGIVTDRTVFYPRGGGQPGDTGWLMRTDGSRLAVIDTFRDRETGLLVHRLEDDAPVLAIGEDLHLEIDWGRRYRLMRLHSAMHMMCAIIPEPVTGGNIRDNGTARLEFDLPEPPDKAALEARLNKLTHQDIPMRANWITDAELDARPELVRTLSVQPPRGAGRVRLVEFEGVDIQPCGGTHVANAREIGDIRIDSIKKKGRLNRRISLSLV